MPNHFGHIRLRQSRTGSITRRKCETGQQARLIRGVVQRAMHAILSAFGQRIESLETELHANEQLLSRSQTRLADSNSHTGSNEMRVQSEYGQESASDSRNKSPYRSGNDVSATDASFSLEKPLLRLNISTLTPDDHQVQTGSVHLLSM